MGASLLFSSEQVLQMVWVVFFCSFVEQTKHLIRIVVLGFLAGKCILITTGMRMRVLDLPVLVGTFDSEVEMGNLTPVDELVVVGVFGCEWDEFEEEVCGDAGIGLLVVDRSVCLVFCVFCGEDVRVCFEARTSCGKWLKGAIFWAKGVVMVEEGVAVSCVEGVSVGCEEGRVNGGVFVVEGCCFVLDVRGKDSV